MTPNTYDVEAKGQVNPPANPDDSRQREQLPPLNVHPATRMLGYAFIFTVLCLIAIAVYGLWGLVK